MIVEGVNLSGYAHQVENFVINIMLVLTLIETDTSPDTHLDTLLSRRFLIDWPGILIS